MSKTPPRNVTPRLWRGLALAGTAAGLATAGHAQVKSFAAPDTSDGPMWLASAEGGEGGEGGAPETATPEAALLIELGKLEAHIVAAGRLFDAGARDDAIALASHPEAEFMEALRARLEAAGLPDVTPQIDALIETMITDTDGSKTPGALTAALDSIRATEANADTRPPARFEAIQQLARDAASEYGHAFDGDAIADLVALEESRAFLNAARALAVPLAGTQAADKVMALIDGAMQAFPDAKAGVAFKPDASVLHGAAARIEIAALSVK